MKNLIWSVGFVRAAKRLLSVRPDLRKKFEQILEQLSENPFDPTLRTHKLKGDLAGA